jgi:protein-disulfide isomerase
MRASLQAACALFVVQLWLCGEVIGDSPSDVAALQREVEALRAAQGAMVDELRELRVLVQRGAALPPATGAVPFVGPDVPLEAAYVKGAPDARVVIVEFSDFGCPFCARHASTTYREIARDYVETGKTRYAFMNFPIESLHPLAFRDHVAAACAADQGRFWEMHDRLFANPRARDIDALVGDASAVGVDRRAFRACLENERHADEIRHAMKIGAAIGVTGTPTFLIGRVGPNGTVKGIKLIAGAKPYAAFKEAIDGVLSSTAAVPAAEPIAAGTPAGWERR